MGKGHDLIKEQADLDQSEYKSDLHGKFINFAWMVLRKKCGVSVVEEVFHSAGEKKSKTILAMLNEDEIEDMYAKYIVNVLAEV